MVDTKKKQECDEIYRVIWVVADELCSVVDICADIYTERNKKLDLDIVTE